MSLISTEIGEIEDDVPMPRPLGAAAACDFANMNVGSSILLKPTFEVPDDIDVDDPEQVAPYLRKANAILRDRLLSAAWGWRKRTGNTDQKHTTRSSEEGVRIWRTA